MTTDEPSSQPAITPDSRRTAARWLPFLLTALLAVATSLALGLLLLPLRTPRAIIVTAPTTVLVAGTVEPAQPVPTPPTPDERVLGQELLDLRVLGERRASFVYLLKAEAQLRFAEEALAVNDLAEVERTLLDVDVTLALAYDRSDDAARSPILQLREQLGLLHDDLYVRPEGLDSRLKRLRQSSLTLVDEVP